MTHEIINGDCLVELPKLAARGVVVDAVVTSPPYNTLPQSGEATGMHRGNKWVQKAGGGYEGHADNLDEREYQVWLGRVVGLCLELSRGLVWVNHKIRYRDGVGVHPLRFLPYPIYSEVIWDRGGSMALNCKRFAPSHEVIYGFGRPQFWDDEANTLMSVWRINPQLSDLHPCPFPVEIPRRLIRASVPKGGTVLDPFAGSCTTGEAAIIEGRNFIGIEQSADYCAIGEARIQRAKGIPADIPRLNRRQIDTPLFA